MAQELSGSARTLLQVQHAGASSMGVLVEAWAGADTEVFAVDWHGSEPQLAAAAERLSTLARLLVEQAEEQDQASEGGGSEAASVPRGRAVPDSGAFPFGRSSLGWPDLRAGLKVPNVNWPGVGALVSPIHSPFVQRPLQYYRDIYQDWQDSGLTWFEAMFVPWPLPDKLRNTYLDLVDDGTDWANDIYKDHVRDLPGIRDARWAAHQANDAVEFADFFIAPLDRAFGPTVPGLAWNIVKDSVNETTEMLDDPKGWWDGASGLDQAGFVASLVPVAGLVGKLAAKSTKEVADLASGAGKHVPSTRIWDDALADLDDATKLKGSDDPLERGKGKNAETAKKLIADNHIHSPDDVWDAGNGPRGLIIESIHGGNLPAGFKVIDRIETVDGVDRAVSTKTLDASRPTYDGKPKAIEHQINGYVRALEKFEGSSRRLPDGTRVKVEAADYDQKVLEVFVRTDSMGADDWAAVDRARASAKMKGIDVEVKEWP